MLARLDGLKIKYEEIGQQMTDPEVIADMKKFVALNKEYKELQPVVEASEKYRTALNHLSEAKEILATEKDDELREMARAEVLELEPELASLEERIKLLLIPADPQDGKNAIVEIRGGTGGDEAALFAGDLLRTHPLTPPAPPPVSFSFHILQPTLPYNRSLAVLHSCCSNFLMFHVHISGKSYHQSFRTLP